MSKKKEMKWSITFEVRYDLDVIQGKGEKVIRNGQTSQLTLTGEELDDLIKNENFFKLSDEEKDAALLANSSEALNIVNKLEFDPRYKNVDFSILSKNPVITLEINGEKYQLNQEELEEYYADPDKYMEKFDDPDHLRKLEATQKLNEKQAKDADFYKNNTYNKKYVSRSNDIKTIMLDEEEYEQVRNFISTNSGIYDGAKKALDAAMRLGSENGFKSTGELANCSTTLDNLKNAEEQLSNRIEMSITVLKNCDEETLKYLETILIDKIFSMNFNDKNPDGTRIPQWEVFENAMDSLLEEVQNELEGNTKKLLEYGQALWNFKEYVPDDFYTKDGKVNPKYLDKNGKPNDLLLNNLKMPAGVSKEDAKIVAAAMVEMSDDYFKFNQSVYDGNYVTNLVGVKEYPWNPTTLAKYFYDHPGLTISEFNDKMVAAGVPNVLYDGLLNGYLSENSPDTRKLMEKYATAMSKIDEYQNSLDAVKSMRKTIPYIKYTATNEYDEIYKELRKAGYTSDGDVNVAAALKKLGITGCDQEKMKYMTVNEMALYAYLRRYGPSTSESTTLYDLHGTYKVGSTKYLSDEYLKDIQYTLDQRQADYKAYEEVIKLLEDGKIDLGEKGIKTLDGFLDGLNAYLLNIERAFTTFSGARKTVDELKEEKIAQILLSYRNAKSKDPDAAGVTANEWNYNYLRLNELAYDYGEITESNYKALKLLYNYISNDDNAYSSITAFNSLYANAKTFGNTFMTTSVAVLGKVLANVPGVGPALSVLCRSLNATEQYGKTVFKLYDPDSDDNNIGAIMTKGLFAALNSYYLNKKFIDSGNLNFGRESVQSILLNTFYVETLKNMNITAENILADIIWGEEISDSDISTYKLIKAIPEFMKKATSGEMSWEEAVFACVDLMSPYLITFAMKGKDGSTGGIKGKETEYLDGVIKRIAQRHMRDDVKKPKD